MGADSIDRKIEIRSVSAQMHRVILESTMFQRDLAGVLTKEQQRTRLDAIADCVCGG